MRYGETLVVVTALAALAGCASTKPDLPEQQVQELAQMTYPAAAAWTGELDIVVVRHGDRVQLVNRTVHSYDNVVLWFNQQYAGLVPHIAIGTGNYVDLRKTVDAHGRAYPVGSLLEPDKSARLVQAEMVQAATNERFRLTVEPGGKPLSKYGTNKPTTSGKGGGGTGTY
jgi:hypothetical protein